MNDNHGTAFDKEELRKMLFEWLNRLSDFKMTQPKKKRQNITKALWKIRNDKPLNKLEKESLELYIIYCVNLDLQVTQ